jgi:hypothetical protein
MSQIRPSSNYSTLMKVIVVSKDELFTLRAFKAISAALSQQEISAELHSYSNFLELLNNNLSGDVFILSEETALNVLEDLVYLKTCRIKYASAVLMHAYENYQPAIMDESVINAVNKFVKKDSNLEVSINKSIKNLAAVLIHKN